MSDTEQTGTGDATGGGEDYSHLFQGERVVSDVELRVDVANGFSRYVAGDEDIKLDVDSTRTPATAAFYRGARTRVVGSHQRTTGRDETISATRIEETVHGGVHQKAKYSAEAIIGGAYVNTIAGPYLRAAGWVDFMAWGGWAEIDMIRAELSLLMIRSHIGYAHAAGVRGTLASRLVDDFQNRTENFGVLFESGAVYMDTGGPGGGVTMEA